MAFRFAMLPGSRAAGLAGSAARPRENPAKRHRIAAKRGTTRRREDAGRATPDVSGTFVTWNEVLFMLMSILISDGSSGGKDGAPKASGWSESFQRDSLGVTAGAKTGVRPSRGIAQHGKGLRVLRVGQRLPEVLNAVAAHVLTVENAGATATANRREVKSGQSLHRNLIDSATATEPNLVA